RQRDSQTCIRALGGSHRASVALDGGDRPTAAAREVGRVGVVEVGVDLGREIDGGDVGRAVPVVRAQLGVEADVGEAVARADPLDRVEAPVDAEEDAAGGVRRGRLAEAFVVPRQQLADVVQDEGGIDWWMSRVTPLNSSEMKSKGMLKLMSSVW